MSTDGQVYMLRSWETQLILLESVLHEVCFSSGWLKQVAHLVFVSQLIFSFFRPKLAIQQWQYCTGALFNPIHPGGGFPPPLTLFAQGLSIDECWKKNFPLNCWNPLFWLFLNNFFTATTHHSEKISTFLETFLYGLPSWYNKAVKKMSSSFLKFESKFTQSLIVNYSLKTTFLWMLLKTIIVDHTKRFPKRCLTSLNDVWLLWKSRLKKGQKMRVQPSPGL